MNKESNLNQDYILEEYYGTDYTGTKFNVIKTGFINKISLKRSYKSLKEIFKVNISQNKFKIIFI